jgi:hypothetical protein
VRKAAGIDLDPQCLTTEVIDDVEGAEATAAPQRIGHEVRQPRFVGALGNIQRLSDASRQPTLASPWQIELQL